MNLVVTRPSPNSERLLELNCLVLGDDPSCVFTVKIAASESVSTLRETIKDKKKHAFEHVDADTLVLWKVSIPVDESVKDSLSRLDLAGQRSLSSVHRLSNVFTNAPEEGHLHIAVKAPRTGKCVWFIYRRFPEIFIGPSPRLQRAPPSAYRGDSLATARQDWVKRNPSRPPSEQGKPKQFAAEQSKTIPTFYFDRPPNTAATTPITLYNSIFAQFQEDCESYSSTNEDHAFVRKISLSMSKFYDNEKGRAAQARDDLATYDLDFLATEISNYTTDGDLRWKGFCYAVLEYKPELGSGGADPLFQAAWYYVAFVRKLFETCRFECSHLPCFIFYAIGELVDALAVITILKANPKVPTLALLALFGRTALIFRCSPRLCHSSTMERTQ